MTQENWFDYRVKVQPHHTDYGGVVWHGAYITWMESARIECLAHRGIHFADWVNLGIDLPVVSLSTHYHRPVELGMQVLVRTRLEPPQGVRLTWQYRIESTDESLEESVLYTTASVVLVPVDVKKRRILRRLPPEVRDAIAQLVPPSI